jgi:hypothetical protein
VPDKHGRWAEVPELAAAAPSTEASETVPARVAGHHILELPESGWGGALLGWAAGPTRLYRLRDDPARHTTVTTCHRNGTTTVTTAPRTVHDQHEIDRDIDEYLTAAGAAPRPSGYRWFIRLPAGHADGHAFFAAVNAATPLSTRTPAECRAALDDAIIQLYHGER